MRGGGEGIIINAADAAFCSASGQCSHFQKSSLNSLQIPAGLENPFNPSVTSSNFRLFLDHQLLLIPRLRLMQLRKKKLQHPEKNVQ